MLMSLLVQNPVMHNTKNFIVISAMLVREVSILHSRGTKKSMLALGYWNSFLAHIDQHHLCRTPISMLSVGHYTISSSIRFSQLTLSLQYTGVQYSKG